MLKIKDNVDLKELEKYGFKRVQCINDIGEDEWDKIERIQDEDGNIKSSKGYSFPYDKVNWVVWKNKDLWICEYDKTDEERQYKEKEILTENINTEEADILYDLIKDDLVEKVNE
jgi:hypothetical protein